MRQTELQKEFSKIPIRHPEESFDNLVQEINQVFNHKKNILLF